MKKSYKIELFLLPLFCLVLLLSIDIFFISEDNFFDYKEINNNSLEDLVLFVISTMIIWMLGLIFFHIFRIIKLGKLQLKKLKINRIVLLLLTFFFFFLIITGAVLLDNEGDNPQKEDIIFITFIAVFVVYWLYYFINFYAECKLVNISELQSEKSLIDELHE